MLHTMTEGKTKTMPALHEYALTLWLLKFKGGYGFDAQCFIELAREMIGNVELKAVRWGKNGLNGENGVDGVREGRLVEAFPTQL